MMYIIISRKHCLDRSSLHLKHTKYNIQLLIFFYITLYNINEKNVLVIPKNSLSLIKPGKKCTGCPLYGIQF